MNPVFGPSEGAQESDERWVVIFKMENRFGSVASGESETD
jgi:hypothetical protein